MTQQASLIDDCFLHDKDRLRHDEALKLLKERLSVIVGEETTNLNSGLGRIACQDIVAPHEVPLHSNSAVDGYAFNHDDLKLSPLPLSGKITAGTLNPANLHPGSTVRIFTGAPMPQGANTIAMQEDCTEVGSKVNLPIGLKKNANCRQAGEDLNAGDKIVTKGVRLQAADLAALASVGITQIPVFQKLKIALFSSGNELREPDSEGPSLQLGEVYDANQPLLSALCSTLPIDLQPSGIIGDSFIETKQAIQSASEQYDVIITSGGASRGEEDHMLSVLDEIGKRHLWQLAVKPGRPMMFGQIPRKSSDNDCLFFGLPGNPVAAMVCFLLYTRPALLGLAGENWSTPPRYLLPADFETTNKKPDRREFLRGILQTAKDGTLSIDKFAKDGSGLISSLREADGLIEVPEEITEINRGDLVSFIPFTSFG